MENNIYCRWAPSLGKLEATAERVWGTKEYNPDLHINEPTVFFGLYGFPDFYALWRHKGTRFILWAGTDIVHFTNGYWLDGKGEMRLDSLSLAQWIDKNCMSFCENAVEQQALSDMGILATIAPSFLGQVENYDLSYYPSSRPAVYASVSGNNFEMYGWPLIERIAHKCSVDFHLYGNTKEWKSRHSNVFVHSRVPSDQMNEEIKYMQGALRLNMPDGFSELLAKSVLWGQWPITWDSFKYPHILGANGVDEMVRLLNALRYKSLPNIAGREYYLKTLNSFPWVNRSRSNEMAQN